MATINENLNAWSNYKWGQDGNEWSESWGGTDYLWALTIYPRIQTFLPAKTILEIAPGYGRITQYLHKSCKKLLIVDITEKCIIACKNRFENIHNIGYFVNDGKSLDMIPNNSIDFVFSWDSLVHAENDVIEAYLGEIASKLTPNGIGFIHHSNLARYKDSTTGSLTVENKHWRAPSMSAELFKKYCEQIGLICIRQEIINWGDVILNDCFSLFTRKNSRYSIPNRVIENIDFGKEINHSLYISNIYNINLERSDELTKETLVKKIFENLCMKLKYKEKYD